MIKEYDLIVSGGGLTGVAAAIAAKRNGVQNVLLIERYGFLGGMATSGLVNPFMSYFKSQEPFKKEHQLTFGIFQEILDRLRALNGMPNEDKRVFDAEVMKLILNRMVIEEKIDLLFHTYVADVKKDKEDHIESITIANKVGLSSLKAKLFIDCTGDADLAYMAQVPCKKGREEDGYGQPMTLCFRIGNVQRSQMPSREKINALYQEAVQRGEINNPRENVLFFNTLQEDVIHFNTTRIVMKDATNPKELTEAEIEAREQCWQMYYFLKENVDGFQNSYFQVSAPQIGVRESRRILGKYVLTGEDVLSGQKFDDSICYNAYTIDIHNPSGTGTLIQHLEKGQYYGIPYRCLLPVNINNLVVAGRPISSDHAAHSSLRIMPTCVAMGQAAGTAAALALKNKILPYQVDSKLLREQLIREGAIRQ